MLKLYSVKDASEDVEDKTEISCQRIERQLEILQGKVQTLQELQRQLSEVKGRDVDVDKKILAAYLTKAAEKVASVESSLNQGLVGLPEIELRRPEIKEREVE